MFLTFELMRQRRADTASQLHAGRDRDLGYYLPAVDQTISDSRLSWIQPHFPAADWKLRLQGRQHPAASRYFRFPSRWGSEWISLWNYCVYLGILQKNRLYRFHFTSGGRITVVARFLSRIGFPRIPLDPIHPPQKFPALHARTGCLSRTARSRSTLCRSGIRSIFTGNRFGIIGRSRRLHRTTSYRTSQLTRTFESRKKYWIDLNSFSCFSGKTVLLVHCRIRHVPPRGRTQSIRSRSTVIFRWTWILRVGQTGY